MDEHSVLVWDRSLDGGGRFRDGCGVGHNAGRVGSRRSFCSGGRGCGVRYEGSVRHLLQLLRVWNSNEVCAG